MSDATYQPKTYRKQGGDELVVAASGAITAESGGIVDFQTGTVVKDTTVGAITDRHTFVDTVDWTGITGAHGNWTAPTGSDILITGFYLKVSTAGATAGAAIDVGTTSAGATTASTNLLDALAVTTGAAGVYYTATGAPTAIKLTAGKWITATATGGALTALVTKAYIRYVVV